MTLIDIGTIHSSKELLDIAFRRANKKARALRSGLRQPPVMKAIIIELERVTDAGHTLENELNAIAESYPSFNHLHPFYEDLTKLTLDLDSVRRSIAAVSWASSKIRSLTMDVRQRIRRSKSAQNILKHRKAFFGRASSITLQITKNLEALDNARRIVKKYPAIKTDMPTVAIAGYPNAGKSTLLTSMTGASPKIAPYPFTTQRIMLGYVDRIQFIDTPGLLDRPVKNLVERHALNALAHLSHLNVFLIDPTSSCGFPFEDQLSLRNDLESHYPAPTITILTKADIATKEEIVTAQRLSGALLAINANDKDDAKKVLELIKEKLPRNATADELEVAWSEEELQKKEELPVEKKGEEIKNEKIVVVDDDAGFFNDDDEKEQAEFERKEKVAKRLADIRASAIENKRKKEKRPTRAWKEKPVTYKSYATK